MATDFEKNAINTGGGILPGTTDTPGDVRTRVATEADIMNIPNPYIGMLVYVIDTGKRFEITKLKDKKVGFSTVKDALVDEYIEFDPSKDKGYAKEADVDAALDLKADKADLEGLASEEFVEGKVDEAVEEVVAGAPEEFDTLAEIAEELAKKVDKVEGKSLVDDVEIARLAEVDNYDDSAVVERLDALEAIDHEALIEGLASEEFVQEKIDAIPVFDDSELKDRLDVLEAIDHEEFLKEHQDISHLAVKEEVDAALEVKADKAELVGLASEEFVAEKIAEVIDGAPEALDTLKELAEAMEAHEDVYDAYVQRMDAALELKADKEYVDAQDKALKEEFRKSLKHEVDLIHEEMVEEVGLINKEMEEEIEEVNRVITEQVEKINSEHTEHVITLYGKCKDLRVRMEALEEIDHEAFITEHQDISHLAIKEDVDAAMEEHEASAQEKFDALEARIAALEAVSHKEPEFEYEVNMIAEDQPASFTVTGEYPNYTIILNLPQCFSYVDPNAGRMYVGWIPFDEAGENGFNDINDINAYMTMATIQQGLDHGSLKEMDPQPLKRTSIGSINTDAGFVCAIFPASLNYVAYLDNGLGGKVKFDDIDSEDGSTGYMYCQCNTKLVNKIDNISYCLYGAYVFSPGERFIYIEQQ